MQERGKAVHSDGAVKETDHNVVCLQEGRAQQQVERVMRKIDGIRHARVSCVAVQFDEREA